MRRIIIGIFALGFLVTAAFFNIGGCSESNGAGGGGTAGDVQNEYTPIIVSFVTEPRPVLGSDGKYHLVYELQLTNATSFTWLIKSLEILNAADHGQVLKAYSGDAVGPDNQIIPGKIPSDSLGGGQTSVFFITFSVDSKDDVPEALSHLLTITIPDGIPDGLLDFLSLPHGTTELVQIVGTGKVDSAAAILTGPPLKGANWIAGDGCCTADHHVRAVMPVNGKLTISQRFAIDWEKMDDQNRIYVGDKEDVNSYYAYGQEILAVGEGRVVRAVDKYDNQVPGQVPVISLEEADGNHVVIDLGNGNFAFYAHMIKGSVAVEEGDFVTRGQVIGLVGNTGNTIAPHLHFHMMSSPSTFGANGIPYMIDDYELIGRAPSTEAFYEAEANGTPLEILPVDNPGIHTGDLPLDLSIVNFPEGD